MQKSPLKQFNPRAPYGVRRVKYLDAQLHLDRSIHALPYGVRRYRLLHTRKPTVVQSTHPYEARPGAITYSISFNPRTHTGCDTWLPKGSECHAPFNPRAPYGGATSRFLSALLITLRSIHAPHTGCDNYDEVYRDWLDCSIHAPHTGCDTDAANCAALYKRSIHAPHTGCDSKRKQDEMTHRPIFYHFCTNFLSFSYDECTQCVRPARKRLIFSVRTARENRVSVTFAH